MWPRRSETDVYKLAALFATHTPRPVALAALKLGGLFAAFFAGDRRVIVERNLERVTGTPQQGPTLTRSVGRTFESTGRYYLDTLRLPSLSAKQIDDNFEYEGFEHIVDAVESGTGPILVLPHLGGWEWAAFWLTKVHGFSVVAVVEPLEPPEVFEWFKEFREQLGMKVIAVGPDAGKQIIESINNGEIVCMLSDRVVADASSAEVEFFGETTRLPVGAAALALRTGAKILPVAVYFRGRKHFAEVRSPVAATRNGKFRDDAAAVTQAIANELERFIRRRPEQWHVLQPGWPSDYRALGRPAPDWHKAVE